MMHIVHGPILRTYGMMINEHVERPPEIGENI